MAKNITQKQFNDLRQYIVVLDMTQEEQHRQGNLGYENYLYDKLNDALSRATKLAKQYGIYSVYIYEKSYISHDKKSVVYSRVLRSVGGLFTDDVVGRFLVVLKNNDSNGQTMSLYHSFCGQEFFQCYV